MRNLIRQSSLVMTVLCISLVSGCSSERVDLVDLNKVLDVFISTMDQFSSVEVDGYSATGLDDSLEAGGGQQAQLDKFVYQYEDNLNKEELMSYRVGIDLLEDGSMEGYADKDSNSSKSSGEEKLFTVEVDAERNRLIATDTQNGYRRDSSFVASMVGGMLAGYMLSRMMSRQKTAGVRSSRFGNMKMSPKNYHKSAAASKAKSSSSSARSRSGSGSYSSGK